MPTDLTGLTFWLRPDRGVTYVQGMVVAAGTSPPAVTFAGTPSSLNNSIVLTCTGAGTNTTATFSWTLNGVSQSPFTAAATVALTGTGITATFPVGAYTNTPSANTYTSAVTVGTWTDQVSGIVLTYNQVAGSTAIYSTAINGSPSITCTIGGYFSTPTTIASIVTTSSWSSVASFNYTGAVTDPGTEAYTIAGILVDSSSFWQGGAVATTVFAAGAYNGGPYVRSSNAITTATNYFAMGVYGGTNIQTSLNGGALTAGTACGSLAALTGTIVIGADYNHAVTYVGSVGDIMAFKSALPTPSQTLLNNWFVSRTGI